MRRQHIAGQVINGRPRGMRPRLRFCGTNLVCGTSHCHCQYSGSFAEPVHGYDCLMLAQPALLQTQYADKSDAVVHT